MGKFLFIITFVLSCFFSGNAVPSTVHDEQLSSSVVETAAQNNADSGQNLNSNAILPSQTARVSGENGGCSPTLRSNNSVRRTQVSQKSPYRIIKDGKVIDRQHFFVFRTHLNLFPSGFNSIHRYIHIICKMLI